MFSERRKYIAIIMLRLFHNAYLSRRIMKGKIMPTNFLLQLKKMYNYSKLKFLL